MISILSGSLVIACSLVFSISAVSAAPKKNGKTPPKENPSKNPELSRFQSLPAGLTYTLKDFVKAKSAEFCAAYGAASECIEDVEICLTMTDRDDDVVRLCVNTVPEGDVAVRSARAKTRAAY